MSIKGYWRSKRELRKARKIKAYMHYTEMYLKEIQNDVKYGPIYSDAIHVVQAINVVVDGMKHLRARQGSRIRNLKVITNYEFRTIKRRKKKVSK